MAPFERDSKITGRMKTKITNDWLVEFPEYKKDHTQAVSKIIGPLCLSIWYEISYSTDIKPGASLFNLANPLDYTYAELGINPSRKSITWEQHERNVYKGLAQNIKELFSLPLLGPVTLSQVINGYKNYNGVKSSDRRCEDPALISAWAGRADLVKECLEWGFENKGEHCRGFNSKDEWFEDLKKRSSDPEQLRRNVEEQIIHHKLTKVPRQELIID
jgi:hypothetical protein